MGFYEGYETYIRGIKNKLEETIEEIKENNSVYLEDELGDMFWDYGENGKENGIWNEIKKKQKTQLKQEHKNNYK